MVAASVVSCMDQTVHIYCGITVFSVVDLYGIRDHALIKNASFASVCEKNAERNSIKVIEWHLGIISRKEGYKKIFKMTGRMKRPSRHFCEFRYF